MGVLAKLATAQVTVKNPFFLPGEYRVQLSAQGAIKLHQSGKDGKDMFIINGKIVTSNNPQRPPGTVCSQIITITGNLSALGNIKGFMAAAYRLDTDSESDMALITEEAVEEAVKSGALNGMVLDLTCSTTLTRAKNEFTVHSWRPVAESPAEVKTG